MANLDIGPDFSSVSVVTPVNAGPLHGAFPAGLINPDLNNWSPRVALAWKLPWTKKSTVVRAGYGIYYNEQAYISRCAARSAAAFRHLECGEHQLDEVLTLARGFLHLAAGHHQYLRGGPFLPHALRRNLERQHSA